MYYSKPYGFSVASIVDPELMMTMPPALTALTGVDAFSHAFESYINVNAHPFSEMVALESIKRFAGNIVEAVKNGSNIKARRRWRWRVLWWYGYSPCRDDGTPRVGAAVKRADQCAPWRHNSGMLA
ncbi:iron-containing alcohol dehydrogenase [Caldanaerobius polysaccharolyticus]|nr:iron-containing alcohol dehydrogenase [Caldanaerobius polysaccharolyticus]